MFVLQHYRRTQLYLNVMYCKGAPACLRKPGGEWSPRLVHLGWGCRKLARCRTQRHSDCPCTHFSALLEGGPLLAACCLGLAQHLSLAAAAAAAPEAAPLTPAAMYWHAPLVPPSPATILAGPVARFWFQDPSQSRAVDSSQAAADFRFSGYLMPPFCIGSAPHLLGLICKLWLLQAIAAPDPSCQLVTLVLTN